MLCRSCQYSLEQLENPVCPECGLPFDPDDPSTYLVLNPGPRDELGHFILVWSVYIAAAVLVTALFFVAQAITGGP